MEKINIVVYGLGPIGTEILHKVIENFPNNIIGAVDIDPNKIGQDIGKFTSNKKMNIKVVSNIQEVTISNDYPCFAIHATGSNLANVWPQIKELLDAGFSVVSTCEELAYPWHRYPDLSQEINHYALSKNLAVISSGVNPGYVMDTLVLSLTSIVSEVSSITVKRHVDVKKRRPQLQQKVGVGMKVDEFRTLAKEGKIGHVGLEESLRSICEGLNIKLHSVSNELMPSIANEDINLPHFYVKSGDVNGQVQTSIGQTVDGKTIKLELIMSTDITSRDQIVIVDGSGKKQEFIIPDGVFGDSATASIMLNTTKTLALGTTPGLRTMKDIAITRNIHVS